MFGRLLLFWSTDFVFGGNFFLTELSIFNFSRVGEIVVVLLLFVLGLGKFGYV